MTVKYYGVPFNSELMRAFVKKQTGVSISKARAGRMLAFYRGAQKEPIMANSKHNPASARDLVLLAKAGLIFPMRSPLCSSNIIEWMTNRLRLV